MTYDDEIPWSPGAEAAFREAMGRRNCRRCGMVDPPIVSLDGTCEDCLHKQGRALCCLEGSCGKSVDDQNP